MAAHSQLGASGAERWLACPGSVALCATVPKPPESPYAREGTAAHEVAQMALETGSDARMYVGRGIDVHGHKVKVTEEMATAVQVYIDTVRSRMVEADRVFIEQKFALTDFDGEMFGRNDASILTKTGHLYVFDYKHGAGVAVSVENNPQLKYYALGAMFSAGAGVRKVSLVIVQPRCQHGGDPVREFELNPTDLIEFGFELAAGAAATRQPDAPLKSGKWCRFCAASGVCPKLYESAQEAAQLEFEDARMVESHNATLSPEELGRRLELAERVGAWISAINSHAYNEALRGNVPVGRKFVAKRGRIAWKNGTLAMSLAAKKFKVSEDELFEAKAISPRAFEKVVGKANGKDFLAEHAETKSSGFSLVPLADKRDALSPAELSEFEPIEEQNDV